MDNESLDEQVRAALFSVIDPELGMNIVELGLVYRIDVLGDSVEVDLTMTTPACPLGEHIANEAKHAIEAIPGVVLAEVNLVWDPPWTPSRMSPQAKEALGWTD
ncbi:MAG TPA: metal-sulfur cluster assembly factor [Pseudomonadota bacterium]|jgi:metal-sulfur cluster biosynthetic enzyme|nr:metal-sulfur cluster assembly factor [Pseudomonadota bacterium]